VGCPDWLIFVSSHQKDHLTRDRGLQAIVRYCNITVLESSAVRIRIPVPHPKAFRIPSLR